MIRRPLGRGLEALLSVEAPVPGNESIEVDVALIEPGSMQPRTRFNEGKLQGLAQSIRSNGIVQPLLVRHRGGRYELIAGERRWRAAKLVGLKKVPVFIRDFPDEKLLELALIENIQRENLDAIEEAHAYKSLLENIGLTQESLAEKIGRDRSYITNYLRLLRLPLDIQILLQDDKISTGHARTLLGISDVVLQRQIARKIVDRGLSVRETERIIQDLVKARSKSDQIKKSQVQDPNLRAFESKLRRRFGTHVRITSKPGNDKGQIQIDFFSLSDLERICNLLRSRST